MNKLFKVTYKELNEMQKLPPRDQGHYLPFDTFPHGCPLGGFGAGTIGRSPYGDFNIWHVKVGAHIAEELKSCTFHAYQKHNGKITLNTLTAREYNGAKLKRFGPAFGKKGHYAASFPKSAFVFDAKNSPAEISCEQFSPILPDNYQETSLPLALFEHSIRNKTDDEVEVSLMLSWANMTGWGFEDQRPGVLDSWVSFVKNNQDKKNIAFRQKSKKKQIAGVVLGQNKSCATREMDGEIVIAARADGDMQLTTQPYFYLEGEGNDLYDAFGSSGLLSGKNPVNMMEHQNYGGAVAVKVVLKPRETRKMTFALAWDLPIVRFGVGVDRYKYYTRFFDKTGKNGKAIAVQGLEKSAVWSAAIDQWHKEIIAKSRVSKLLTGKKARQDYFRMLINELYFLSDGGCHWDADTGSFGLLECFDYPYYETLDVRFYGSFPLLKFWPEIELKIMEDFAATVQMQDTAMTRFHFHTDNSGLPLPADKNERLLCADRRKKKGACPHDLGSPKDNPFNRPAAYTWQNTNYWKDLNTKFVLLCWRDYKHTGNNTFLKKVWPDMIAAFEYVHKMDKDRDGIPENSGYPDQTYDNWVMHGVSAYCGSLWIASIQAMLNMAQEIGDKAYGVGLHQLLDQAQRTFDKKLWNGAYYDFCEGNTDIMADQLIGQWYMDILKQDILPEEKIRSALKTIYDFNCTGTKKGRWGIVSGKQKDNRMVEAEQGRDIWVGANFALCSLFLHHGMPGQAEKVLGTLSRIIYEQGFFFRTPEGWDTDGCFTATMYMRPNAIWSLEF